MLRPKASTLQSSTSFTALSLSSNPGQNPKKFGQISAADEPPRTGHVAVISPSRSAMPSAFCDICCLLWHPSDVTAPGFSWPHGLTANGSATSLKLRHGPPEVDVSHEHFVDAPTHLGSPGMPAAHGFLARKACSATSRAALQEIGPKWLS